MMAVLDSVPNTDGLLLYRVAYQALLETQLTLALEVRIACDRISVAKAGRHSSVSRREHNGDMSTPMSESRWYCTGSITLPVGNLLATNFSADSSPGNPIFTLAKNGRPGAGGRGGQGENAPWHHKRALPKLARVFGVGVAKDSPGHGFCRVLTPQDRALTSFALGHEQCCQWQYRFLGISIPPHGCISIFRTAYGNQFTCDTVLTGSADTGEYRHMVPCPELFCLLTYTDDDWWHGHAGGQGEQVRAELPRNTVAVRRQHLCPHSLHIDTPFCLSLPIGSPV